MKYETEVCLINADDGQIQQALLNLLINARDAMVDGGTITISTARVTYDHAPGQNGERAGDYVSIAVADTGTGMDRATQQHIFEPFFTTKEQGKGTGLGLAVVYGVVNGHNGFVNVLSEAGQGSQFTLFFPLFATAEASRPPERERKRVASTERILLVDDEEDVGDIIRRMLITLGYKVTFVRTGRKAISAYKRSRYSTVILDLNMPEMGGRETLEKLREIDPSVRVIISTGYSNKKVELADLVSSVDGFLQKPYQIDDLERTLQAALSNSPTPLRD